MSFEYVPPTVATIMPRPWRVLKIAIFIASLSIMALIGAKLLNSQPTKKEYKEETGTQGTAPDMRFVDDFLHKDLDNVEKNLHVDDKPSYTENSKHFVGKQDNISYNPNPNVHAFYYAWYGNPDVDGKYFHWNHIYMPHWNAKVSAQYPTGKRHQPPDDIGASFYPRLGPYSSLDEEITRSHLLQFWQAGIGVLALSWYPPGQADDNGKPIESYIPTIFDIASEFNVKVCFHIEPYPGRNAESIKRDIKYVVEMYGNHPAFYRHRSKKSGKTLPLIYVYDSYLVDAKEWQRAFTERGDLSIRHSDHDCLVIGLLVEQSHLHHITASGFDGMYTYFAADGFSFGSKRNKWADIALHASRNNLLFIPSVGPGYDDTRVRPWNKANSRGRQNGAYYESGWQTAARLDGAELISITSFNEWHEGTQIEPADGSPRQGSYPYLTYGPEGPDFYLELTRKWSDAWRSETN